MNPKMVSGVKIERVTKVSLDRESVLAMRRSALRTVVELERTRDVLRTAIEEAERSMNMLAVSIQQNKTTYHLLNGSLRKKAKAKAKR